MFVRSHAGRQPEGDKVSVSDKMTTQDIGGR
jgi:hypothetical protein